MLVLVSVLHLPSPAAGPDTDCISSASFLWRLSAGIWQVATMLHKSSCLLLHGPLEADLNDCEEHALQLQLQGMPQWLHDLLSLRQQPVIHRSSRHKVTVTCL